MSDNVTVSNAPASSNPDIPVRTIDKSGEQVQVMAIDYGGAGTEDLTVPDFATEVTLASVDSRLAGGIGVTIAPVSEAALSNVASSTSSVTLLASNVNRRGAILMNDSSGTAFIKFGAVATNSDFTYKLLTGGTLELPMPCYTGVIDAIWNGTPPPSGSMRVTELT